MDHVENDTPNNSSVVMRVFIAVVTLFTEMLLSDDRGIHIQTQSDVRDL
jgi:hypothetical protein